MKTKWRNKQLKYFLFQIEFQVLKDPYKDSYCDQSLRYLSPSLASRLQLCIVSAGFWPLWAELEQMLYNVRRPVGQLCWFTWGDTWASVMAEEGGFWHSSCPWSIASPLIPVFPMCADDCSWPEIDLHLTNLLLISLSGEYTSPHYSEQITP